MSKVHGPDQGLQDYCVHFSPVWVWLLVIAVSTRVIRIGGNVGLASDLIVVFSTSIKTASGAQVIV